METVTCGHCYAILNKSTSSKCSKCYKRHYCNRDCQVKDWKKGRHKTWCGKTGEIGYDYQIVDIPGKGKGVVALRDFEQNERIMTERMLLERKSINDDFSKLSEPEQSAVMALMPVEGSLLDKFLLNAMSCSEEGDFDQVSGLFINMSRINHDCLGNSFHWFIPYLKSKALFASRKINAGEEITFSYMKNPSDSIQRRQFQSHYHVDCHCEGCSTPSIMNKMKEIPELDEKIGEYGQRMQTEKAIKAGEHLLQLYEELHWGVPGFIRTYYDLFQVGIMRRSTLQKGKYYIRLAVTNEKKMYEGLDDQNELGNISMHQKYAEHPETHRNYLIAENRYK
jgi:hypothetical protein